MMMPPAFVLRVWQPADACALAAIAAEVMPYAWTEATFASCAGDEYIGWVILQHQQIVAGIVARLQMDTAELLNIVVSVNYQRQGLGVCLITQLCQWLQARGVHAVWLEVRQSNLAAQHLYERMGFVKVAERPNYYPAAIGRETAWIYRLQFLI